jgi:hypothetical protein
MSSFYKRPQLEGWIDPFCTSKRKIQRTSATSPMGGGVVICESSRCRKSINEGARVPLTHRGLT